MKSLDLKDLMKQWPRSMETWVTLALGFGAVLAIATMLGAWSQGGSTAVAASVTQGHDSRTQTSVAARESLSTAPSSSPGERLGS